MVHRIASFALSVWIVLSMNGLAAAQGVTGSGAAGTIPVWTGDGTMLTNSLIQSGTAVGAAVTITAPLSVSGTATFDAGGGNLAVAGSNGIGLSGNGTNGGLVGNSSGTAAGVYGQGGSGAGVFGQGGSGGAGVVGNSGNSHGVVGTTSTNFAAGLAGFNTESSIGGTGVYGTAQGPNGIGVFGEADTDGGGAVGVFGVSATRIGVEGMTGGSGAGVLAASTGSGPGLLVTSTGPSPFAGVVQGNFLITGGNLRVDSLGSAGTQQLCLSGDNVVSSCSSSLRYKTDVQSFSGGLDIVNRLRPILFSWKQGGVHDVGLAAEDVAEIEPLLTFRNDKGEIEGVKYNQLSAVFVNAIREQQAQIKKQQDQIDALKELVCQPHPNAAICQ